MLMIKFLGTSCDITLRWMPQNIFDDKSTLVQVIAWCPQQQDITWANADPDLYHDMASPGHNELNNVFWGLFLFFHLSQ